MRKFSNLKQVYVKFLFLLWLSNIIIVLQSTSKAQVYWGENLVEERSWLTDKLKGKVKRIETQVEWDAPDAKTKSYEVAEYGRFGKLIYEDQKSEQSGIQNLKNLYQRDDYGNLLQKKTVWEDGSEINAFQAKYDPTGRLMEYFTNSPEQHQVLKNIISYGQFGRSKVDVFEEPRNLLSYSVSYIYSSKGVLQEILHFNQKLKLRLKEDFHYLENNQKQEHIISECDESQCREISEKVKFKKGKRIIKKLGFDDADSQDFYYWGNGNFRKVITTTQNISGTILKVEKYDYLGNLILSTEKGYNKNLASTIRCVYKLDKNKNWTEKTELSCRDSGGKEKCDITSTTKRNISYFEN